MNEKEIFKIIKEETKKDVPNILHKIDLQKIEIKPAPQKEKHSFFARFSLLKHGLALSSLVLIIMVSILVGPSIFAPGGGSDDQLLTLSSREEEAVFQAITGASVASSSEATDIAFKKRSISLTEANTVIDHFHLYMPMLENVIGQDELLEKRYNDGTNNSYPKDHYTYYLKAKTKDALGIEVIYELYYNLSVETDEDEAETEMYGYILYDVHRYYFEAEKEVEMENSSETETEVSIKVYTAENKQSYIEIEKEHEGTEHEYSYKRVLNNNVVEEAKIEIEFEGSKMEAKIEIKKDNQTSLYEVTKTLEGSYEIKYKTDDLEGDFMLEIKESTYIYEIDGKTITKQR